MCLDLVGGPINIRVSLLAADLMEKLTETTDYRFLPCPNQLKVKESFLRRKKDNGRLVRHESGRQQRELVLPRSQIPGYYGDQRTQERARKLGEAPTLPAVKILTCQTTEVKQSTA